MVSALYRGMSTAEGSQYSSTLPKSKITSVIGLPAFTAASPCAMSTSYSMSGSPGQPFIVRSLPRIVVSGRTYRWPPSVFRIHYAA